MLLLYFTIFALIIVIGLQQRQQLKINYLNDHLKAEVKKKDKEFEDFTDVCQKKIDNEKESSALRCINLETKNAEFVESCNRFNRELDEWVPVIDLIRKNKDVNDKTFIPKAVYNALKTKTDVDYEKCL